MSELRGELVEGYAPEPGRRRRPQPAAAQMMTGLLIMAVGVAVLLGRVGLFPLVHFWRLWPLLIIGAGLVKLATPQPDGSRHGGGMVLVGVWLLLHALGIWSLGESWPIFLVAYGLKIVWNAVAVPAPASRQLE